MAITATFTADFTKWNEGLRSAQANLKPLEVSAKGLQRQLEQTAKAFSGVNIKREAEIAAAAVKSIGGAVRLTTDELKKYSATIDQAVQKSQRLGQGISPALAAAQKDIAAAKRGLKEFSDSGSGLKSIFGGLGSTIAGAFAIGSILSATRAVLAFGGQIKDLANRTGFTTKAVQELKFAAEQSGVSFDAIATASFKLQKNLGDNNAGTVGALRKLGLSVEQLKALRPEDAFTLIASKLGDVKDGAERASLGAKLMGKGFQDVSQLINDGIDTSIAKAREFGVVLSDDTIKKLDDLGDTLSALQLKGKATLAEALVPLTPAIIAAADALIGLSKWLKVAQDTFTKTAIGAILLAGDVKLLQAEILELSTMGNPVAWLTGAFDEQVKNLRSAGEAFHTQARLMEEDLAREGTKGVTALISASKHAGEGVREAFGSSAAAMGGFRAQLKQAQADLDKFKSGSPEEFADLVAAVKSGTASMEDMKDATGLSELALKLFQKQVQETNKALKETDAFKVAKSLKELEASLRGAEAAGISQAEVLQRWGGEIRKLTVDARAAGVAIPEMVTKAAAAIESSDLEKAFANLRKATEEIGKADIDTFAKSWALQLKAMQRGVQNTNQTFATLVKAHDAYEDAVAKRTLSATDLALRELKKQEEAEIASIEATGALHEQAEEEIRKLYGEREDAIRNAGLRAVEANRRSLVQQAADALRLYRQMASDHKFSREEIKAQEQALIQASSALFATFGADWKDVLTQMGIDWRQFADFVKKNPPLGESLLNGLKKSAAQIPDILIQGLLHGASFEDIAASVGTSIGSNIGGAIGLAIGGPLGEALGQSLGSLLGPLLEKLITSDAERAVDEIGRVWGVTISEEMGDQIEKTMKTRFEGMRNNRWLAEVFNLGDIIKEVGITSDNIGDLALQLRQSFVFLSEGAFSVSDTAHVLNESFNEFAKFYTDRNALLSAEMVEIVALDRQLGVHSEAVAEFVKGQVGRAIGGLEGFTSARQKLIDDIATARKAVDDLVKKKAGASEIAEAKKHVQELSAALAAVPLSAKGALGLGAALAASFAELLRQGEPITEILRQIGPLAKSLGDQFAQAGVSGGAAFAEVLRLSTLAADSIAGPAIQAVADLNDVIAGLSNSGLLTQDVFTGLSGQLTETFTALQAQGKNANDVMALMAPTLQTVWELWKDGRFAVDATTEALLRQAEAAGVVGDANRTVQEQMLVATNRIATAVEGLATVFGVQLPQAAEAGAAAISEAMSSATGSVQQAGDDMEDSFGRGQDAANRVLEDFPEGVTIPIDFPMPDVLPLPDHPTDISIPVGFPTIDRFELPDAIKKLLESGINISSNIDLSAFEGLDDIKAELDALGPAGKDAFADIQAALTNLADNAPDASAQLHDAISAAFDLLPEEAQTQLQKITNAIYAMASTGSDNVAHLLGDSFGTVGDSGLVAIDRIQTAIDGLPSGVQIPVDFPMPTGIVIPPHLESITIPVDFDVDALDLGGSFRLPDFEPFMKVLELAKEKLGALGPVGIEAMDQIVAAMANLAASGTVTADQLTAAILPALESLGPAGTDAANDLLAAFLQAFEETAAHADDTMSTVGEAIARFPEDIHDAFDRLPDHVDIPIGFPIGEITIPEHPDNIEIPVRFEPPDLGLIGRNADQIEVFYQDAWDRVRGVGVDASSDVAQAWLTDQATAAETIDDPYLAAWQRVSDSGVQSSEDIAASLRDIPDAMPRVRDQILEELRRVGTVGSGRDGIGRIAEALNKLPGLAENAAAKIEDKLGDIDIPDIKIAYRYKLEGDAPTAEAQRLATGGLVKAPLYAASGMFVPKGSDIVPAMLTPGEFVINRDAASRVGTANLAAINRGDVSTPSSVIVNVTNRFTIQSWDGEDVLRVLKAPTIQKAIGDAAMRGIEKGGHAASRFDERVDLRVRGTR